MLFPFFSLGRMHSNSNPDDVIRFQNKQLQSLAAEKNWLDQDNLIQRATIKGLQEKISQWEAYGKSVKDKLVAKENDLKDATNALEAGKVEYRRLHEQYKALWATNEKNRKDLEFLIALGRMMYDEGQYYKNAFLDLYYGQFNKTESAAEETQEDTSASEGARSNTVGPASSHDGSPQGGSDNRDLMTTAQFNCYSLFGALPGERHFKSPPDMFSLWSRNTASAVSTESGSRDSLPPTRITILFSEVCAPLAGRAHEGRGEDAIFSSLSLSSFVLPSMQPNTLQCLSLQRGEDAIVSSLPLSSSIASPTRPIPLESPCLQRREDAIFSYPPPPSTAPSLHPTALEAPSSLRLEDATFSSPPLASIVASIRVIALDAPSWQRGKEATSSVPSASILPSIYSTALESPSSQRREDTTFLPLPLASVLPSIHSTALVAPSLQRREDASTSPPSASIVPPRQPTALESPPLQPSSAPSDYDEENVCEPATENAECTRKKVRMIERIYFFCSCCTCHSYFKLLIVVLIPLQ